MVVGDFTIMDFYHLGICVFDCIYYYCGEKKEKMITEFAKAVHVPALDILENQDWECSNLRNLYWFILRENGYTTIKIGALSGKDHSTVVYGLRRIRELLEIGDKKITSLYEQTKHITKYDNSSRF
jgi:chromosomal replication initiation ATPase DnaA